MVKHETADHRIRYSGFRIDNLVVSLASDLNLLLLVLLISSAFVLIPGTEGSIVRAVLGFALVMLVPGYAMMAAYYPRKGDIGGYERIILSVAVSICVTPLIGFILNYTRWGIRLEPVMLGIIAFTFLCIVIATVRRRMIKSEECYSPDIVQSIKDGVQFLFPRSDSGLNRALSVFLVLVLLGSIIAVSFAIIVTDNRQRFTEFYIMGTDHTLENQTRGYLVGEPQPVVVGIANHERGDVNYTLTVSLDDGSSRTSLYRQDVRLADNQTWEEPVSLAVDRAGKHMKMIFSLFKDGNTSAPYREVYMYVDAEAITEKYTQFDVLTSNNTPLVFNWFTLGGGKNYNVTVYNHEYRSVPYTIMVVLDNNTREMTLFEENISLPYNRTYQKTVRVIPNQVGNNMVIRFLLFKDNDTSTPYSAKDMIISVRPAPATFANTTTT